MKKIAIFNSHSSKGFTLIELLTVITILSVIGTIVVTVITITFRGTRKADLLENARQNGDTALSLMVKNIRYAKSLDAPASCVPPPASVTTSSIKITSLLDNQQTIYSCSGSTIASNGASLFDTNSLKVTSCSFVCTQPTLLDPPTITIQYTLSPAKPGSFTETKFTVPFQSSVTLRNLNF